MAPNTKVDLSGKIDDGEMDLSMMNLQEVPVKEIAAYRNVWSLDLSKNNLVQLTKQFPTLTNLTKLDLSKNKLKRLPDNFGDLYRLRHLDLYKNELTHLPLSFGQLKNLKWLDLMHNPLVPAIKEAAGECADIVECQACATNMIYFFTKLREKVEEERDKRIKHNDRVREDEEVVQKPSQTSTKKERKKELKASKSLILKTDNANPTIPLVTEKPATEFVPLQQLAKTRPLWKYFLMSFMLFFTVLFILTAARVEQTLLFEEVVVSTWKGALAQCPKGIQKFGNNFGTMFGSFHHLVSSMIIKPEDNSYITLLREKVKRLFY